MPSFLYLLDTAPPQVEVHAKGKEWFGWIAAGTGRAQQEVDQLVAFARQPVGQQLPGDGPAGYPQAVAAQGAIDVGRQLAEVPMWFLDSASEPPQV